MLYHVYSRLSCQLLTGKKKSYRKDMAQQSGNFIYFLVRSNIYCLYQPVITKLEIDEANKRVVISSPELLVDEVTKTTEVLEIPEEEFESFDEEEYNCMLDEEHCLKLEEEELLAIGMHKL